MATASVVQEVQEPITIEGGVYLTTTAWNDGWICELYSRTNPCRCSHAKKNPDSECRRGQCLRTRYRRFSAEEMAQLYKNVPNAFRDGKPIPGSRSLNMYIINNTDLGTAVCEGHQDKPS
jgi:hypothetical protein